LSAIEESIKKNTDLSSANLCRANLCRADLSSANLCRADLSSANLCGADLSSANLCRANLCRADLSSANLSSANLCGANLCRADLSSANLCGADLCSANLCGADLCGANLYGVKGVNKYLTTPLYFLMDQPGIIWAYKMVLADGFSPMAESSGYKPIEYKIGENYNVEDANTDENEQCKAGISLASMDWIIKNWKKGNRIFIAEHTAKDIAAIPIGSDGKYRVFRCKIVGEKDPKDFGLE